MTDLFCGGQHLNCGRTVSQSLYAEDSIVDVFVDALRGFGFCDEVVIAGLEGAIDKLRE